MNEWRERNKRGYQMPYRYGDKLITLFVAERGGVEGRRYRYATQTFTGDTVDMINNKRSSSSNVTVRETT